MTAPDSLIEAQKLYRESLDATREQRRQCEEDLRFSDPSDPQQWDDAIKRQRESDPGGARPCLVHDQVGQYISNVAGQFEQNPPSIHTIPVDSGADKKTSDQIDGILRHIEHVSRAQAHYARALTSAARCGVGYLLVRPEYVDRALGWQEPRISSEGDPLRVVFDPWSVEIDGSDATFAYRLVPYSHREWVKQWGDREKVSFGDEQRIVSSDQRESVLAAESWRVDVVSRDLLVVVSRENGEESTMEVSEYRRLYAEVDPLIAPSIEREYTDKVKRVFWSMMSGVDYLVPEREFLASGVGIVPMYGYVGWSDGRMHYCGMARRAREPQQSYNYHISEIRAYIADAPKAPWIVPMRALDGPHKDLWDRAAVERRTYLPYKDIDEAGQPIPAPQRTPIATNLSNLMQGAQQSLSDIQAALGMYQANLGAPSNETSGVAIESRKQQGEASTSHFTAHAASSISQVGRLLVDMLPKLIDTKRTMRIMGIDQTPGSVVVDPQSNGVQRTQDGSTVINPSVGHYDVRVVVGAAFSTQRQQAQAAYTEMMRANPNLTPVIGPLWAQTLDVPHADKLAQVLTAVAPPEVQAILKPQDGKQSEDEMAAQIEQMKKALQEAIGVAQETQQECDQLQAQLEEAKADSALKAKEVEIKQFDAETKRMQVEESSVMDDVQKLLSSIGGRAASGMEPGERGVEGISEALESLAEAANPRMPESMTITAPSGNVYQVQINGGNDVD